MMDKIILCKYGVISFGRGEEGAFFYVLPKSEIRISLGFECLKTSFRNQKPVE